MVFRAGRVRAWVAFVLAIATALTPAVGSAKKKVPPLAVTIICHREVNSPTGQIEVTRTLDTEDRLIGISASWVYRMSVVPGDTALQAGWYGINGAELDLSSGSLGVDFDTGSAEAKQRLSGKRYTVELSTSARPDQGGFHLRGRADRFDMFARSYPDVTLDWEDVAAMARGGEHLFIVARDKNGKLLRSVELDRSIFAKAVADVADLADQVRRDAADPAKNCRRETETNDIVL